MPRRMTAAALEAPRHATPGGGRTLDLLLKISLSAGSAFDVQQRMLLSLGKVVVKLVEDEMAASQQETGTLIGSNDGMIKISGLDWQVTLDL
jgi:hypothetical protein